MGAADGRGAGRGFCQREPLRTSAIRAAIVESGRRDIGFRRRHAM